MFFFFFFFSSRRRHTRCSRDWSSDVCSSDLADPLSGYGFRHSACNRDILDPAFAGTLVAACDRVILAQAEYRGHISLHWAYNSSSPEDEQSKSLFTLQGPDLVVLGDAGQAWLVGNGPGRLPSDRLPTLGSWLADLGLGVDRSEEHTSELQSRLHLVCRLLLEKKK